MKTHNALALCPLLLICLCIAQAQQNSPTPTPAIQRFQQCVATATDSNLASTVIFPDNASFPELAYSVWNTAYNATRTPAAVAQPRHAAQVSALVRCANQASLRLVVRGGGHSYEAMSLINRGLIIDLSRMLELQLLPSTTPPTPAAARLNSSGGTRRLIVGAGMRWGPVYAFLFQQNMTMEGPTCPSVGVSGSTLGGGTGHSTRRLGLLADQLRAVEVVTMAGEVLHVSATSHPDLFWALRGGGANYAIATAFEFEVVPAPTNITYASLWWEPTAANLGAVLKAFTAWQPWLLQEDVARVHIGTFTDKIMFETWLWPSAADNTTAADIAANTTAQTQQAAIAVLEGFLSAAPDLPPPREHLLLTRSFERYMLSQSVTDCYGVSESEWGWANISTNAATEAAEDAWRAGLPNGSWTFTGGSAVFVDSVPDVWDAFAALVMPRVVNASMLTRAVLIGAGGHQRTLPDNHTGFGHRAMTMQVELGTQAVTPADAEWVRQALGTLMPASGGRRFWNHLECVDRNSTADSEAVWRAYFGKHARQLRAVKAAWDPEGRLTAMNCSALN